jgi:hypothetical protein
MRGCSPSLDQGVLGERDTVFDGFRTVVGKHLDAW